MHRRQYVTISAPASSGSAPVKGVGGMNRVPLRGNLRIMNGPIPRPNGLRGKVLLIDDDFAVRLALGRALESEGYSALLANDGDDALQRLGKEKCDVVVLDLDLTVAQGWDAFQRIRHRHPDRSHSLDHGPPGRVPGRGRRGRAAGIMEKPLSLPLLIQQLDKAVHCSSDTPSPTNSLPTRIMTSAHE